MIAKVRRRLIPFVFLLYIIAYLDRINVGFAALQMNQAIGLSATAYGLGAGIFFLSYTLRSAETHPGSRRSAAVDHSHHAEVLRASSERLRHAD